MVVGLIYGVVYHKTKSLRWLIIAHALMDFLGISVFCCFFTSGCSSQTTATKNADSQTTVSETSKVLAYKDGTYEGRSENTYENYYGSAELTVKDGKISSVDFEIIDDNADIVFDEEYGPKMFAGQSIYLEQCVSDLAGIKEYKKKLVDIQDNNKIDTISGATWSRMLFRETVMNALKDAVK